MATLQKTVDDITRTKSSLDGTERVPGRDNLGDFKISIDNFSESIKSSIVEYSVKLATASYVILDNDGFDRIEVDTTSGDITITLPLMANNLNRKIQIANIKGGTNKVIIVPNAANANKLSNDGLNVMWLPKIGNMIEFVQSTNSGFWEVITEKVTSQLRLNTYAGYGGTDNKIMRFTTVVENVGNMFGENHSTGYSSNAKGLEITINRSGKYFLTFTHGVGSGVGNISGLSLNSSELTTAIQSITSSTRLGMNSAQIVGGSITFDISKTLYFKKNDIIRPHTDGSAGNAFNNFFASYLGQ